MTQITVVLNDEGQLAIQSSVKDQFQTIAVLELAKTVLVTQILNPPQVAEKRVELATIVPPSLGR